MNVNNGARYEHIPKSATLNQVNYVSWMMRLLTWDAPLAFCVAVTPTVLLTVFDHPRKAEPFAILVFIVVFVMRYRAGIRQIASNCCSQPFKDVQQILFILAVVPFAFVECVVTMTLLMKGPKQFAPNGMIVVFAVYYLSLMTIVMYPGRTILRSKGQDDVLRLEDC